MVTIVGYKTAQKDDGKSFFKLQLQGGVEPVQSQSSGRLYLTARTCSIPTTLDENNCKRLTGTTLPGSVVRVKTDPYQYTLPETGDVISLNHRWEYDPFDVIDSEGEQKLQGQKALV